MGREEILRPARLVGGRRALAGLVRWSGSVNYEEMSCGIELTRCEEP